MIPQYRTVPRSGTRNTTLGSCWSGNSVPSSWGILCCLPGCTRTGSWPRKRGARTQSRDSVMDGGHPKRDLNLYTNHLLQITICFQKEKQVKQQAAGSTTDTSSCPILAPSHHAGDFLTVRQTLPEPQSRFLTK